MKQELHDVTTTFDDARHATIRRLTTAQTLELQTALELSGVWYRWHGQLAQSSGRLSWLWAWIDERWRHLNAWLAPLLIVSVLSIPVMAQEGLKRKPNVVEPVRVALTLDETAASAAFDDSLRRELSRLRRVTFVSEAVNFDIYVTSGPITAGQKTIGYASAVAVVTPGKGDKPIRVLLVLGPTLEETARLTARRINEEFFSKR